MPQGSIVTTAGTAAGTITFTSPAGSDIKQIVVIDSVSIMGYSSVTVSQIYRVELKEGSAVKATYLCPAHNSTATASPQGNGFLHITYPDGTGPKLSPAGGAMTALLAMESGSANAKVSVFITYHYGIS